MSVVTATPDGAGRLQKLLRCLAAQTIAPQIEVVVVAPSSDLAPDDEAQEGTLAGLGWVTVVPVGPIDDIDGSLAAGIRAARASVVALIEDHAYPDTDWAEALVLAHRGPWTVVGPAFRNANPASSLSWANMLMAYGAWLGGSGPGAVSSVSRHNASFKREALLAYGGELERRLVRGGGLLDDLRRRGHALYFEPRARVAHVNPSRLGSTLRLRFHSGRLDATRRVEHGSWSRGRRGLYLLGSPLIPLARLARLVPAIRSAGLHRADLVRSVPALSLALAVDATGQAAGFALGAGSSEERLRSFELDRRSHVRPGDKAILSS